jgi:hypothetical protein
VKKIGLVICVVLFSIVACKTLAPVPQTQVMIVPTIVFTSEVSSTTEINLPTNTVLSTDTPAPTNTPSPTDTPLPTPTTTPPPQPLVFSGSGDMVLDINKWPGPAIAHFAHTGQSNFIVESFAADNSRIELLVNTIGNFKGVVPVDFDGSDTKRFTIKADGPWEIQILPLSSANTMTVPGSISGEGDDVILLGGSAPDKITIDASQASSNFVLFSYSNPSSIDRLDLLVNEIAPYTGVVLAPNGTGILVLTATGPWKLDISGR